MGIAPSKNNLELHKVYVIKNERRKGIARKLVLKAEKYAKKSNYKKKPAVAKVVAKAPIKISKTYVPKDTEKYMCEKHKVYFRI